MWQLAGTSAAWTTPGLVARLDLLRPYDGLVDIRVCDQPFERASLLRIETPYSGFAEEVLIDAYVRGCDLIATYAQTPARQIRPQIYWRALAEDSERMLGGMELIVSTQTSLLDADTSLATWSLVPASFVSQLCNEQAASFKPLVPVQAKTTIPTGPGLFLFRPPHVEWSYVEMVYPTDFADAQLSFEPESSDVLRLTNSLFAERLEKGVIRRGRIRGLFLPRSGDEMAALAAYREFIASPLPLTT